MHLYVKLAFCLTFLTDKLSQPSKLRRNLALVSARFGDNSDSKILKFLAQLLGEAIPYSSAIIEVWFDKTFVYFNCSVQLRIYLRDKRQLKSYQWSTNSLSRPQFTGVKYFLSRKQATVRRAFSFGSLGMIVQKKKSVKISEERCTSVAPTIVSQKNPIPWG